MTDAAIVDCILRVLAGAAVPMKALEISRECEALGVSVDPRTVNEILCSDPKASPLAKRNDQFRWLPAAELAAAQDAPDTNGLNPDQLEVAHAGPERRLLVIASAGTGKTHTVIERLRYLTDDCGLGATREVLVLSFSRAAVAEIRSRLAEVADDSEAGFVRVLTFDRFAYELLLESGAVGSQDGFFGSYDRSIKAATQLVRSGNEDVLDRLEQIRHFVVDEIQDLVGCRADLVLALTERIQGGMTMLGDPSQSIYGWQLNDHPQDLTADEFLAGVRGLPGMEEKSLRQHYRARTTTAQRAAGLGEPMRVANPRWLENCDRVERFIGRLPRYKLGEFTDWSQSHLPGSAAILCRNNGQCLLVAERLRKKGVPCSVRRRAEERLVPGWLAIAFGGRESKPSISRDGFDAKLDSLADERKEFAFVGSRAAAWRALAQVAGGGRKLNLDVIAQMLVELRIPDELLANSTDSLVISTVHRAKGLEYDNVGLYGLHKPCNAMEKVPEETRVKYVALSRARDRLATIEESRAQDSRMQAPQKGEANRWVLRRHAGRNPSAAEAIEFLPQDIDSLVPPDTKGRDAAATYLGIRNDVCIGDGARLRRIGRSSVFEVVVDGLVVGRTSASWASACRQHFGELPLLVGGLFVSDLRTACGPASVTESVGLGQSGMWLLPVLAGMAYKEA